MRKLAYKVEFEGLKESLHGSFGDLKRRLILVQGGGTDQRRYVDEDEGAAADLKREAKVLLEKEEFVGAGTVASPPKGDGVGVGTPPILGLYAWPRDGSGYEGTPATPIVFSRLLQNGLLFISGKL